MRAQRVSRLRQQIDTQRKRVGLQKQRLEDKTRHVERAAHLLEIALAQHAQAKGAIVAARRDALAVAGQVSRQAVVLRQDRIIFEDLRAMLARQRALAVGDLAEAFPVEMAMDEADWTICGLRVSSAEGVRGWQASEETAAALGLVTRLLDALARYLCVPLRFPVVPRGSRSAVCCLFSGSVEWWPLFMLRAADRPRLHTALRLLAVDIEQLLCQHGMESVDPERKRRQLSLLPNLTQLLMAIETSSFAQ
ncbi:hypothetical protein BX661DRAFT_185324 [Kickxella alabastrina]|uniref:uncharacterized protein n=1 Tax=Kickxella alabastrina TaxID=61397 RepID=UPI00222037F1|nr:uncharacterized protein BX661DRAFT_185324 [Kickxella alabastrina]KAI7824437.1 hypothetical protein BX661DRAFT_185324 [Kickxella alabastrina]